MTTRSTDAAFWNNIAQKFAKKPVGNPEAFERKVEITKSRMTPRDVILDVGCGTGSLALRLAPYAARVHGLDLRRILRVLDRLFGRRVATAPCIFGRRA